MNINLDSIMKNFTFIVLVFCCSLSHAQTIATDRPSALTENASTLFNKGLQLETGIQINSNYNELTTSSIPNFLMRYGITNNIEIRIMNDLLYNELGQINLGNWILGSKIQLIKNDQYTISLLPSIQFDQFSGEFKTIVDQPVNTKIVGNWNLNSSMVLGYSLGYTINNKVLGYSVLISRSLNDKFTTFIELYGFNNKLNIDSGIAYIINNNLQFDTYFGAGLNTKIIFGSIGLSYLFLK